MLGGIKERYRRLGKQIYSRRMSVAEPVFGNIGTNKRLNRFSLRGKEKVQGQWRLFCLVHNIEKLMQYGEQRKALEISTTGIVEFA